MGLFDIVNDVFGGSDKNINLPESTPQETQIRNLQADTLNKQAGLTGQILPLVMKSLGITTDANGNPIGSTSPLPGASDAFLNSAVSGIGGMSNPQATTINSLLSQRIIDALNGSGQTDPTLTRTLQQEEQDLNDRLRSELGTGYATSTPGSMALSDFAKRKAETLFNANQGIIGNYGTYLNNNIATNANTALSSADLASRLRGTTLSELGSIPGIYSPVLSNIQPFLQQGLNERANYANTQLGSAKLDTALQGDMMSGMFKSFTPFDISKIF